MTATERLRAMLDERGVEWEDSSPAPSMKPWKTSFMSFTGEEVALSCYDEPKWIMGTLVFHTPEQAIEATLGRGECRMEKRHMDWRCTGCGEIIGTDDPTSELFIDGNAVELWHYCPGCGRKVRA